MRSFPAMREMMRTVVGGRCSAAFLGVVSSPEECCFPVLSAGLGGAGYIQDQSYICLSCNDLW